MKTVALPIFLALSPMVLQGASVSPESAEKAQKATLAQRKQYQACVDKYLAQIDENTDPAGRGALIEPIMQNYSPELLTEKQCCIIIENLDIMTNDNALALTLQVPWVWFERYKASPAPKQICRPKKVPVKVLKCEASVTSEDTMKSPPLLMESPKITMLRRLAETLPASPTRELVDKSIDVLNKPENNRDLEEQAPYFERTLRALQVISESPINFDEVD